MLADSDPSVTSFFDPFFADEPRPERMQLSKRKDMRETDQWPRWFTVFFQVVLVTLIVPVTGLMIYWLTPVTGAIIAAWFSRKHPDRSVYFAWLPGVVIFLLGAQDPMKNWHPGIYHMSYWTYVFNTMFGPGCSASECLYTLFSAPLTGGIAYSIVGSVIVAMRSRAM